MISKNFTKFKIIWQYCIEKFELIFLSCLTISMVLMLDYVWLPFLVCQQIHLHCHICPKASFQMECATFVCIFLQIIIIQTAGLKTNEQCIILYRHSASWNVFLSMHKILFLTNLYIGWFSSLHSKYLKDMHDMVCLGWNLNNLDSSLNMWQSSIKRRQLLHLVQVYRSFILLYLWLCMQICGKKSLIMVITFQQ